MDDAFICSLGERAFAAYSRNPRASMRFMLAESGSEAGVAELSHTQVGFAIVGFERLARDFGPWRRPLLARLNAIAVKPDVQDQGVGRRLLAWAEELARARAAVSLTLNTAKTNLRARRLFESAGFLPAVELKDIYTGGQSAVAMFKPL